MKDTNTPTLRQVQSEVKPRGIRDGGFAWLSKSALRKIRESLDSCNAVASGLAVYLALAEIASDSQSESFSTTQSWIAQRSGLGLRTVKSRLADLKSIGLVKVETPILRAPAKYTLLATDCPTIGNDCTAIGNGEKLSLPRSEQVPNKLEHTHTEQGNGCLSESVCVLMRELNQIYNRKQGTRWNYEEERLAAEVVKRADWANEFQLLKDLRTRTERRYFPQSIRKLLSDWESHVDRANSHQGTNQSGGRTLQSKLADEALRLANAPIRHYE